MSQIKFVIIHFANGLFNSHFCSVRSSRFFLPVFQTKNLISIFNPFSFILSVHTSSPAVHSFKMILIFTTLFPFLEQTFLLPHIWITAMAFIRSSCNHPKISPWNSSSSCCLANLPKIKFSSFHSLLKSITLSPNSFAFAKH